MKKKYKDYLDSKLPELTFNVDIADTVFRGQYKNKYFTMKLSVDNPYEVLNNIANKLKSP